MVDLQDNSQRIDKWLWFARFFKTRSLATQFVSGGKIRLTTKNAASGETSSRVTKASQVVRPGDVLTFPLHGHIRVIEVMDGGQRRGPAVEAALLYTDLAPVVQQSRAAVQETKVAERPRGSGRPTKKQRRALEEWLNEAKPRGTPGGER